MTWPTSSCHSYLLRLPLGISTKARSSCSVSMRSVIDGLLVRAGGCLRGDMRRVAALLAAALAIGGAALAAGCGGDGAEPGAPSGASLRDASLVLDFTPNAAHSGIYTADAEGFYDDAGIEMKVEQPGASTDGPKLLAAG